MKIKNIPDWILNLDTEDIEFIKKFILSSGSLKEIAKIYDVSYPTVRTRLDRIIQKITISKEEETHLISFIKKLAIEERISLDDAKILIDKYKKEKEAE
ncbi:DUF2089 family protein [Bacillus toyonensis]|uniref:DUF2089 family protein n=1 Tax=Bacillus toyonensis TaxID=155322 RepID=UPI001C72FEC2|nr:DUF2089 family protein [Bacillus toyonensis]MBX0350558.1 DUF2089 domain-containing protein [Bacillus toyonensis]UKS63445.1 DUF2089 domain-containing protein [Bacillus toyonensis]